MRYSSGASASVTTRALYARSTILCDEKYMKRFMAPLTSTIIMAPPEPPK
jgi:hypothetical protein